MGLIDKLLKIAASDIGYTESPPNSNRTKFNEWYGSGWQGEPWCMMAVQYWHDKAGLTLPYKTASCSMLLNWYKKNHPERVHSEPKRGRIIIYNFGHTGIVESSRDGYVTAIEGNTCSSNAGDQANGGGVYRRKRKTNLVIAYIDGVGNRDTEDEDMTGEQIYKKLNEYLKELPVPEWAEQELKEAIDAGITDGTRPMQLIPRYQAAIMSLRAARNASKY